METTIRIPEELLEKHDFTKLYKFSKHPREKNRLLALSHFKEGKAPPEIAWILRVTRNTVYTWIRNFKTHGIDGLKEKPGIGKKAFIPDSETAAFRSAVLELQAGRSGGVIIRKDVLQLIKDKYGVECSLKSAYNYLKRARLVWISARSRHPNANPEEQEEFKKNFVKK
jgi:transposase